VAGARLHPLVGLMPRSAPSRCTAQGCGNVATYRGRCDEHQPPAWSRGKPRESTGDHWGGLSGREREALKRRIIQRDRGICYVCSVLGATEVDHIIPVAEGGARTDPANLAAIHERPCHSDKTKREARRGAARARAAQRRRDAPPPF